VILVTGATGFVGRRLVRRLAGDAGLEVRVLLRPGSQPHELPRGVSVHAMMGSLADPDSLLAAMDGVHTLYHLISTDTRGRHARLEEVDIRGTETIIEAALAARVGRIITVSRVGADRASAYDLLRAKGEIEELVRSSGLAYTIFRSTPLFGAGDHFSEHLAMMIRAFPFFLVPGDGDQILQPLWVEDLVTGLTMALQDLDLVDQTVGVGGPELLTYRRIVMRTMYAIDAQRPIINSPLQLHQAGAWFLDGLFARWPFTEHWVEMLASNQTAELGTLERLFGIRPAAFDIGLIDRYLRERSRENRLLHYAFTSHW
jgi:uncharacterized protein YbjT (DUF2867 family)